MANVIVDKDSLAANLKAEVEKQNATVTSPEKTNTTTTPTDAKPLSVDDINEEQFNQLIELGKQKGFSLPSQSVTTLTPEEEKKQAELLELDKLNFAVSNGKITNERYNELKGVINSDGNDLTKKEFVKSFKEQNKDATTEQIEAAFEDYYWVGKKIKEKAINDEGEEIEVERDKYDETHVKWGQGRIQTKADRIKANAKAVLDEIDSSYKNYKVAEGKATEYSKTIEKVVAEITPEKYSVSEEIGDKKIDIVVDLGKTAATEIRDYLVNQVAGYVINSGKHTDKDNIKLLVDGFVQQKYRKAISQKIYEAAKSEGLREGSAGINAPIIKQTYAADRPDELEQRVKDMIPKALQDSPSILNRNRKN